MTFSTQAPPKLTTPRAQRRRGVAKKRKRGITNTDFLVNNCIKYS